MKYRLIKKFPKSPKINTIVSNNNVYGNYRLVEDPANKYYQFEHDEVENYPEFWEVYNKQSAEDIENMWANIFVFLSHFGYNPHQDYKSLEQDFNSLMLAYTILCDKLPFKFCLISGGIVYGLYEDKKNNIDIHGEVPMNLFDSLVYVVGTMCSAYNRKKLPIVYE